MSQDLREIEGRGVHDENDLAGYCLNCINKHAGKTHELLKEVENRIMTGNSPNDFKVKKKMKEVMENLAHIEDHSMVERPVSPGEQKLLTTIARRANAARGKVKKQNWDNLSPRSKTLGSLQDIQDLRIAMWDLMKVNDEGRVEFGCGDCTVDLDKKDTDEGSVKTIHDTDEKILQQGNTLNNITSHNEISQTHGNDNMSIQNQIKNATSSVLDRLNTRGLDGSPPSKMLGRVFNVSDKTFNTLAVPSLVANFLEGWVFEIAFTPGFAALGQFLSGLGLATLGTRGTNSQRSKNELFLTGTTLMGKLFRMSPGEWSSMTSQLGSLGRLALNDPKRAILAPINSIEEMQTKASRKANIPTPNLAGFLGNRVPLAETVGETEVESPTSPSGKRKIHMA